MNDMRDDRLLIVLRALDSQKITVDQAFNMVNNIFEDGENNE